MDSTSRMFPSYRHRTTKDESISELEICNGKKKKKKRKDNPLPQKTSKQKPAPQACNIYFTFMAMLDRGILLAVHFEEKRTFTGSSSLEKILEMLGYSIEMSVY